MEAIGSAASISQLAVYSFSSIHYLRKLSSELSQGKSIYYEEERNIRSLLSIVSRFTLRNDIGAYDPVLPILVDISRLAYDVLHYLQPKVVWGINLTPLINRDRIISSLASLDTKRELLHLHIAQVNSDVLSSLQSGNKGPYSSPKMSDQTRQLSVNDNDVQGVSETLGGTPTTEISSSTKISVPKNTIPVGGAQLTANGTQLSDETLVAVLQAKFDLERHRLDVWLGKIHLEVKAAQLPVRPKRRLSRRFQVLFVPRLHRLAGLHLELRIPPLIGLDPFENTASQCQIEQGAMQSQEQLGGAHQQATTSLA